MGNFQARLRLGAAAAFTLFSLGACNDSGSSGSGTTPGSATLAQQMIGPSGGTMTVTDPTSPYVGTSITVPAGALATTTTLTLSQVSGDPNVPANAYEFALGPSGTQFAVPVTITVKYNPAYLSSNGIADATTLKIVSMDPGVANQTLLTTAQDTVNDTITAQTTHFSSFVALGYTTATLNGTYHFVSYSFNSTTTNPVIVPFSVPSTPYSNNLTVPILNTGFTSQSGTVVFDGAGNVTVNSSKDRDGTISSSPAQSGTYTVAPDGTVTLPSNLTGRVLVGGSLLAFSTTSGDPELGFALKDEGGTFATASLTGTYRFIDYQFKSSTTNPVIVPFSVPSTPYTNNLTVPIQNTGFTSSFGTAIFDGAGGIGLTTTDNRDGTASTNTNSGTYTLGSDGTLTLSGSLSGNLIAGGSMFVFSSTNGDPEIGIGMKVSSTAATDASLKGVYGLHDYLVNASGTNPVIVPISVPSTPYSNNLTVPIKNSGFTSDSSTAVLDGAGGVTLTTARNRDGTASSGTGTSTYTVNSDGSLALPNGLAGQMLPDGSAFIMATESGVPEIVVGVLQ